MFKPLQKRNIVEQSTASRQERCGTPDRMSFQAEKVKRSKHHLPTGGVLAISQRLSNCKVTADAWPSDVLLVTQRAN